MCMYVSVLFPDLTFISQWHSTIEITTELRSLSFAILLPLLCYMVLSSAAVQQTELAYTFLNHC